MLERAIRKRMTEIPALTALVSDRIYPVMAPQGGTLPCVVFRQVGGGRFGATLDGKTIGPRVIVLRLQCMATTYDAARNLARAVRGTNAARGLHAFFGTVTGVPIDDSGATAEVAVRGCALVDGSESDDYVPDVKLFIVAQDYQVTGKE